MVRCCQEISTIGHGTHRIGKILSRPTNKSTSSQSSPSFSHQWQWAEQQWSRKSKCFKNHHRDPGVALTDFQERVTAELAKIPGLEDLIHSDLPSMRAIDDSTWNNEESKRQRRDALSRVTLEFMTLMKPPSDGKKRGQCSHANCHRISLDYPGSNFHWDHFRGKNLAVLERQGVESDHTKATSKRKAASHATNLLDMTDEICHAPSHCYNCHKCRTKNQDWSSASCDYTTCWVTFHHLRSADRLWDPTMTLFR